MRIDKLWIDGYKNFVDFTINFQQDSLINILLGKNGTGKSNIIEVIASIFMNLETASTKKAFSEQFYYYFDILYFIEGKDEKRYFQISIKKDEGLIFKTGNNSELSSENAVTITALKRNSPETYLPKYVVAYYSGDGQRLKNIFKKGEERYYQQVIDDNDQEIAFRRFFYTEPHHSQLLLISLLAFASVDEGIAKFLEKYLDFSEFVDFTITLKSPSWNRGVSLKDGIDKFWGAKGTPLRLCNYLYTESRAEPVIEFNAPIDTKNKIRERISFYVKGQEFLSNSVEYFKSGIDLFRHLESTYISQMIESIKIRIKKKNSTDIIGFEELSEGEQQLIAILGLLLFTKNENCLFLLDEPDTHLNPNWQRDYIDLFGANTENIHNHILISTHSPLMVQAAENAGIILFKLENGNPKSDSDTHFIKNWRIDQVLTSEYFGLESSRPPQLDNFMKEREALLNKAVLTEEDLNRLKEWESDLGLLPSGETMNDFLAMQLVRSIAKDAQNHD